MSLALQIRTGLRHCPGTTGQSVRGGAAGRVSGGGGVGGSGSSTALRELWGAVCAPAHGYDPNKWRRACQRSITGGSAEREEEKELHAAPPPPPPELRAAADALGRMAALLHSPRLMLGELLDAVRCLYSHARAAAASAERGGGAVAADELLPLMVHCAALCGGVALPAACAWLVHLGCYSPCGEAARYLTDLCAVSGAFPSRARSILTDNYLWPTCSCHEIQRANA
jgi:hypothetical protein